MRSANDAMISTIIPARRPRRLGLGPLAVLALALTTGASPVLAQKAGTAADAEARMKKLEAEVKALQRSVFPGGDGKYFPPEIEKAASGAAPTGTPATTPVSDLLTRMEAVETQLSRITAQSEETGNRLAQLEAKIAALTPPPAPAPAPATTAPAPSIDAGAPAALVPTSTSTASAPAPAKPAAAAPAPAAAAPKPLTPPAKPAATAPAKPAPASRVAAVKAIEKPKTDDAGDDEYSYGYRLWEAKFYPEAAQQLNLFLDKYPKHARVSFARNLLGRVLLDDGKPYEAGQWFLKNYQADKKGARAPDSLLYLGEAMRQLKHNDRACVALKEFAEVYKTEATGRLKSQYEATKSGAKCS